MHTVSMIEDLYKVLLMVAAILLLILLYNNLVLYRRKLNDRMSLMLLSAAFMCAFELLWNSCNDRPELRLFSYIGSCGYAIASILFEAIFNWFFLEQFHLVPRRKWLCVLLYAVPPLAFTLLCITTPWTHLVFWVDENGAVQEMVLFRTLFEVIQQCYIIGALLPAIYYAFIRRHKNPRVRKIAKSMVLFGILAPAIYLLQILVSGETSSDYLSFSLAIAVALVYLCTNVSTQLLLETQAKVEAVETDLRIAANIQADALPPVAPKFADHLNVHLRASMNTAREVGGDFYDYFAIDDHRMCFLIADVSGKGTPAALFMMTAKTMIKDYALTHGSTAEIFTSVNRRLCENNDTGMFATAWIGILDTRTMLLQFTNAGHNYPLIKHGGENSELLKKRHGLFLAGMEDTAYRESEIQLTAGDRLLLYTDGVTEAHNPNKELYGEKRLMALLDEGDSQSGEEVLTKVLDDVNSFAAGEPQFDDITMMILTIKKQEGEKQ